MSVTAMPSRDGGRYEPTPSALWFGVLGGPAAWAAQLALGDLFSELGCEAGGFSALTAVLLPITVVALLVAIPSLLVALRSVRRVRATGDGPPQAERSSFMATIGVLSACLFIALIAVGGFIPHLFLGICAR